MNNYLSIIEKAKSLLPRFQALVKEVGYEEYGVLYSEALFVVACISDLEVGRIIESGTARGQSALLFSSAFPQKEVITIEFDKNSPNSVIADERFKNHTNIKRLFGDSRKVLPKIVKKDDVVMIDGPKMFVAVRLAINLLSSGNVLGVFIHDLNIDTHERIFLNKFFPEALFSDYKKFAETAGVLDEEAQDHLPEHKRLSGLKGDYGYGFSMAWIPFVPGRPYYMILMCTYFFDLFSRPREIFSRFVRKIKKLL